MIVLAIISHLITTIFEMRFLCIFVIPFPQFITKRISSSALIWINFSLDCEKDRALDIGLKHNGQRLRLLFDGREYGSAGSQDYIRSGSGQLRRIVA